MISQVGNVNSNIALQANSNSNKTNTGIKAGATVGTMGAILTAVGQNGLNKLIENQEEVKQIDSMLPGYKDLLPKEKISNKKIALTEATVLAIHT